MKRTTIMLPLDLKAKAERRARERGISLAKLVPECLSAAVEEPAAKHRRRDPLFSDAAAFEGATPANLSSQHDHFLYGPRAGG